MREYLTNNGLSDSIAEIISKIKLRVILGANYF